MNISIQDQLKYGYIKALPLMSRRNQSAGNSAIPKFRLNSSEFALYTDIYSTLERLNANVFKLLLQFKSVLDSPEDLNRFLIRSEKIIDIISKQLSVMKGTTVGAAEYLKICRLIFEVLYYIAKYDQKLLMNDIYFVENKLVPKLQRISQLFRSNSDLYNPYSLTKVKQNLRQSPNDQTRYIILYDFCNDYLTQKGLEKLGINRDQGFSCTLLRLCSAFFVRSFLRNIGRLDEKDREKIRLTHHMSSHFWKLLLFDGALTYFALEIRNILLHFVAQKDPDLETQIKEIDSHNKSLDEINKMADDIGFDKLDSTQFY